ncbi:PABS domain-containing protein [Aphelenchoides fujianensis]|nr:PABS domain-containing protein [Aphelenchoides fujianensis]
MCEIDAMVVDVAKKFLPKMSAHFADPRLHLTIGDGFEFLKQHENEYDVSLFGTSYYELINLALREGGVLASQCESIWLHLDLIKHMVAFTRRIFPSVAYAFASVPTYPSGTIGFLLASKTKRAFKTPLRVPNEEERRQFRFYNERIHSAAFQLPDFCCRSPRRRRLVNSPPIHPNAPLCPPAFYFRPPIFGFVSPELPPT